MELEGEISNGWDKGLNYLEIKDKLIKEISKQCNNINNFDKKEKHLAIKKLIYLVISSIQLRNGSRITEAINAFKIFIKKNEIHEKVTVKIGKSDSIKTNKLGNKIKLKARYRNIKFPEDWIDEDILDYIIDTEALEEILNCKNLKRRICDYLTKNFLCNTHSLRYACINHLLYEKKVDMNAVCKFVGHSNNNQLIRYTQMKQVDKIFDIDI